MGVCVSVVGGYIKCRVLAAFGVLCGFLDSETNDCGERIRVGREGVWAPPSRRDTAFGRVVSEKPSSASKGRPGTRTAIVGPGCADAADGECGPSWPSDVR